jgi:CheY-like chemotaxis protein
MVNMAAFWMCELAPTEIAGSDAFSRNQLACRKALTHDRASQIGRVAAPPRLLRVLVVDDDQDTTNGLVRLVRRWGHAVRFAYDGAAGLKMAAAQHPDVVVLDVAMPLMDGGQVARQLRLDFPKKDCLIIAVTGSADEEGRQQCSEAGIDLVLIKPVQPSVLETLLMLECARVNRSRTDNRPSTKGASKLTRKRLCADERDGGVKTARSHIAVSTASGRQP